jgi:hypothetical protein
MLKERQNAYQNVLKSPVDIMLRENPEKIGAAGLIYSCSKYDWVKFSILLAAFYLGTGLVLRVYRATGKKTESRVVFPEVMIL